MHRDHPRIGAVAAGSAPAADAAMQVLRDGGNAVDAAIAGSLVQCVVEMPWCGIGGDAFVLVHRPDGTVVGFNGSGAAPLGVLSSVGDLVKIPRFGPLSVAVPAIVDAWVEVHEGLGSVPFAALCEPARRLAGDGFVLDERLAAALARVPSIEGGDELAALVSGVDPVAGQRFVQRDLAGTIEILATDARDAFYGGILAKQIADHVSQRGGALGVDDLALHHGMWASPVSTRYRDTVVHSNALVSSGVLVLVALRVLEGVWPEGRPTDEVAFTDFLVRLKRLLFGVVAPQLGDPQFGDVADVLNDGTVERLRAELIGGAPGARRADAPAATDTTSLAVADTDGTTVCFIHSLFNEFGSRELVPSTGIVLNDRLANLVVVDQTQAGGAPNALVPGKRPLHTLHGYVVTGPDGRVITGATPGGRGQVQTNVQVLTRIIDGGVSLQDAVSAPRWVHGMPRSSADDDTLYVEPGLGDLAAGLVALGHQVEVIDAASSDRFGNCTVVSRHDDVLGAAADHRRGGKAIIA